MKKVFLIIFLLLILAGAYIGWQVFGPTVKSPESKYLYVPTGTDMTGLKKILLEEGVIKNDFWFDQVSNNKRANFKQVIPGRYKIQNNISLIDLIRLLKNGRQEPVRFTINKLRTKEDLARKIGNSLECDSIQAIQFLLNNDSLKKYNLDTNTVMSAIIPNTYFILWNTNMPEFISRMKDESEKFWTNERLEKAKQHNLTPLQVYIIASIVEEETNKKADKGNIASVYINRYRKRMKLQADPTVKYSLRDFGIKRVMHKHLTHPSEYNTYYSAGLPPGPICTPSTVTIDEVLNAPETDYMFFVASSKFDGSSVFAKDYQQHLKNARAYQKALDSLIISRNQTAK